MRATGLLDTPVEAAFDRFTALAHRLLGAPVCLLTLVDAERHFVKSAIGLPEPLAGARQVPTGSGMPSFCQYLVAADAPLAVDNARAHPTFGEFPSVRHLGASACAGAPLRGPDGHPLGTLCVLEYEPRVWTENDRAVLLALADAASAELALRLEAARAHAALAHQATHDTLTGLANRALFRDRVGRALERRAVGRGASAGAGDHVAVLFVDLDDFARSPRGWSGTRSTTRSAASGASSDRGSCSRARCPPRSSPPGWPTVTRRPRRPGVETSTPTAP